jgi:hypothetical protein
MANLSTAFKGRPAGEHANTEAPHNELDAAIHNDIEGAIVLVNEDAENLLSFVRGLDDSIQFDPDVYETPSTVGVNVVVKVTVPGGKKNPFTLVQYVGVEILGDTTSGAFINGSPGPVTIALSQGEGQVNLWAPDAGHVKLGLIDAGGSGLDVSDTAMVYVDEVPPPPSTDSHVFNRDGQLIKVLQDLQDNGLGLIEALWNGVVVGQRRKIHFTGLGISSVFLENGTVRVDIAGGGGGPQDEIFQVGAGVTLLDLVWVDAVNHVSLADAASVLTMPGIGFAVSPGGVPGEMYVRTQGKVSGFAAKYPGGLTPGALYFADPAVPGGIISPGPVGNGGRILQEIGRAKNADELLLFIDQDFIIL